MTTSYDLGALKQPDEVGAGRDPRDIILPQPGFKTVLANRDFRLIWSAQVASQLADKFLMFALLILTYSISRRAPTAPPSFSRTRSPPSSSVHSPGCTPTGTTRSD